MLSGWILIAGLLLLLGWATRTLDSFDERVLVAWLAATPAALFAAQLARADACCRA